MSCKKAIYWGDLSEPHTYAKHGESLIIIYLKVTGEGAPYLFSDFGFFYAFMFVGRRGVR